MAYCIGQTPLCKGAGAAYAQTLEGHSLPAVAGFVAAGVDATERIPPTAFAGGTAAPGPRAPAHPAALPL